MIPKALLEGFTARLRELYGEGLISVVLYGSQARGAGSEYRPGHSNINIAVVLSDASLPSIAKAHRLVNERSFRDVRPLFFTEKYIETSRDVFPIEFLDMQENYSVLHGKDFLHGIEIDTKNLRFQCEQELKSKLVTLKAAYLRANGRAAATELLFRSFTSIVHIMRNLIRLNGSKPPYAKEEIIAAIERDFGIDGTPLKKILEARRPSSGRLGYAEADALLVELAGTLERATELVDKL